MTNKNSDENKFDWNEYVIVSSNAPMEIHSNENAYIVGMEKVNNDKLAKEYNTSIGKWIYTIEFDDGSDVTIPEEYLEKYEENTQNNS